jgi:tRNA 2-selenouridine synthase
MDLPEISDYRQLFLQHMPLLDVRAPVEFEAGAFPDTTNMPLLTNEERHVIGIRYKNNGQEAAVALGQELIDGAPKQERVAAWKRFVEQNPNGVLYCFRGGMRSKISQQWIAEETGIAYPRVKGGYKALRNFLLDELGQASKVINPIILGGRTGSGKTIVLQQLHNMLDLEGLAWHRGSAFGRHATRQPTQIDFENSLSIQLLRHRASGNPQLVIEDEGKSIGSHHLPSPLYDRMCASPLVLLEVSIEERINNSVEEYVTAALSEYQSLYGEQDGFDLWADYATDSLGRIKKRLGGSRYKTMNNKLQSAIHALRSTGDAKYHSDWIRDLLTEYYDPMYDYQIKNKLDRVVFRGNKEQVVDSLRASNR